MELPQGVGLSCSERGRTMRLSWSRTGVEETARWAAEVGDHGVEQPSRSGEPLLVEGGLVEGEQALGEAGVVLQKAVARRAAVLPGVG